jgi:AAA domain
MAKKRKRKRGDIESRIVSVDEANPYLKVLIYGRNGKGKTRFAASGPNTLIGDVNEKGTLSARGSGARVFPVETWADIDDLYWYLKRGDHEYETVAIDTLTALAELCMKHVLKESLDRDPTRPPKVASKRDWGTVGTLMSEQIYRFRNLPMHVVFTCQERTVGDAEEGEEVYKTADLPGKARAAALGSVSIIGRVYKKKVVKRNKKTKAKTRKWQFRLLIGDHEDYETKDRAFSGLGPIVVEPTMTKLIQAATSTEGADDD